MKRGMRPVRLSFAAQGQRLSNSLHWLVGRGSPVQSVIACTVLALSLGVLAVTVWRALELHRSLDTERVAHSARRAATPPAARPAASTPNRTQAADWNQALRALNLPWPALLDALEQHTPSDVALVAIESDPRRGRIRLQFEGRTLDGLLAYAATLRRIAGFDDVTVLRHETRDRDAGQPVWLTLDLDVSHAPSGGPR